MIKTIAKQPCYNKSLNKFYARKSNEVICRSVKNVKKLPKSECYYTLCHLQDQSAGSEIVQYVSSGFLESHQFVGIDNDINLIEQNKQFHPDATFLCGDWIEAIKSLGTLKGMIYLDTINELRSPAAARILCETMWRCEPNTLIIANFCANNPRKGNLGGQLFNENILIENILKKEHPLFLKEWNRAKKANVFRCVSYLYRTNKAWMRSYIFFRGILNSESLINKLQGENNETYSKS